MSDLLQPEGWALPKGYANGVAAAGRLVFVAGQVGWNAEQKFETADFVGQARQALANVVAVVAAAGGRPDHIVRLTWYVVVTGEQPEVAELQDFVKERIAPYKYPRAIDFIAALPRTETGKLQRFRLRQAD